MRRLQRQKGLKIVHLCADADVEVIRVEVQVEKEEDSDV